MPDRLPVRQENDLRRLVSNPQPVGDRAGESSLGDYVDQEDRDRPIRFLVAAYLAIRPHLVLCLNRNARSAASASSSSISFRNDFILSVRPDP